MSGIRIHYDSPQPHRVGARAFARGSDVHIGPGQERHVPHEIWHVAQQRQGRVRPTTRLGTSGLANEDATLEREADVMGRNAARLASTAAVAPLGREAATSAGPPVMQLQKYKTKGKVEGIEMAVSVEHKGEQLALVDHTKAKGVGRLSGVIDYKYDESTNTMALQHFEAQPAGFGLGTLLMYELALHAESLDVPLIEVSAPAFSAMAAYAAFGGKPKDPDRHKELVRMYRKTSPDSFRKQESAAAQEAAVQKARYLNPKLTSEQVEDINYRTHMNYLWEQTQLGAEERIAQLKALSAQLVYEPTALRTKTESSLTKKWAILKE